MLARVQVEHEIRQRTLQLRAQVPVDGEASAGQLHRAFQIENAEFGSQIPMRLGSEIKFRRRAPAANFDILLGALADGNARMRQVRNVPRECRAGERRAPPPFSPAIEFFSRSSLVCAMAALASCPLFFNFAISSDALLR